MRLPLLGPAPIPRRRLALVSRYSIAQVIHGPEEKLRFRIPLLGGAPIPRDCLGGVLGHSPAIGIPVPEEELRLGISPLGVHHQPLHV